MKRILCICISIMIVLSAVTMAVADSSLPTIKSLLSSGKTTKKTEVSDNLAAYSPLNDKWEDWDDSVSPKFLVLERRSPEKEFTKLVTYPPFKDDDGFPDDFMGVDLGKPRLWLRGDLMKMIPSDFRATSLQNATQIIMAEDIYIPTSTLIIYDYTKTDETEAPEFETIEEMTQYLIAHQPQISSKSYCPVFCSLSLVTIYEAKTKKCAIFEVKESPGKQFARNPEASLQWSNMTMILDLLDYLDADMVINVSAVKSQINSMDFVQEEEKKLWISRINAKEYNYTRQLAEAYLWKMTEDLKKLDPSEKNRNNYDLIIQKKDTQALYLYAENCDYSGFDRSMDLIKSSKEFISSPDWAWLESTFQNVMNELFGQ